MATKSRYAPPLYAERLALFPLAVGILALWMQVPHALAIALLATTLSWAATYLIASRRRDWQPVEADGDG